MKNKTNKKQLWRGVTRINYLKFLLGFINGVRKGIKKDKKKINDPFLLKNIEEQEKAWIDQRKKIVDKIEYEEIKEKGGN